MVDTASKWVVGIFLSRRRGVRVALLLPPSQPNDQQLQDDWPRE